MHVPYSCLIFHLSLLLHITLTLLTLMSMGKHGVGRNHRLIPQFLWITLWVMGIQVLSAGVSSKCDLKKTLRAYGKFAAICILQQSGFMLLENLHEFRISSNMICPINKLCFDAIYSMISVITQLLLSRFE